MVENLEDILKNGFQTWRNNLSISIPFFLSSVITLIIIGVVLFFFFLFAVGSFFTLSSFSFQGFPNWSVLMVILLLSGIVIVIIGLIDAFFEGGAIGMSKEATQKGKTSLGDMVEYGKKKFISLFFANILVSIIVIAGGALLLGIFLGIPYLLGVFSGYGSMNLAALLFIILGFGLTLLYALATVVVFAPVKYALVVSNLGAMEGVKRGYDFFNGHKLDVFLIWLLSLGVGMGVGIISAMIRYILSFIPILGAILSAGFSILTVLVSILVIAPLTAVWWTRLYLDRTKKISQKKTPQPKEKNIHI